MERDTTLGDTAHLVTTLRNLVPLLVRIDEPAAAAELCGAVAGDGVQPTHAGPWVAAQTVAPLLAARRRARTSQVP